MEEQLPEDYKAAVVIHNGREVIPPLTNDSGEGKVGLPHLIDSNCWVFKAICGADDLHDWTSDQSRSFQDSIYTGLRDIITLVIRVKTSQFP